MTNSQDGKPGKPNKPKLLDQVRAILRLHHYSLHTERSYLGGKLKLRKQKGEIEKGVK